MDMAAKKVGWLGRFNEGLKQLRKAQDLEPTSAMISFQTEWALFLLGKVVFSLSAQKDRPPCI